MDCPICGGTHHVLDCPETESTSSELFDTVCTDPRAAARELDISLPDEQ